MTLFKKLMIGCILMVSFAVAISTVLAITGQTRVLNDELIGKGRLMARQIGLSTREAFGSLNWISVERAIQNVASAEDVLFCKVVMPDETVYLADDKECYGEPIEPDILQAETSLIEGYVDPQTGRPGTLIVEQVEIGQETWWVLLAVSLDSVNEATRSVLRNNLLLAIAIMIPTIGLSLVLSKGVSGPIAELANAAKEFAAGRLDHPVDTRATGEVGVLTKAFNEMIQELRASQEQLEDYSKGLEDALVRTRESEMRVRALADNALDGIYMVQDDRYTYCNQALADMLGYTVDGILALKDRTVIMADTPLGKPLIQERYRARLRGDVPELPSQYEAQLVKKDGQTIVDVVLASSTVELDGRPTLIVLVKDFTERKRAEEQIKASLQEKVMLLKEIHHRVKNNLQVISSLLYLQSKKVENQEALEVFRDSQNRVRSMALIHERLYQSKDLARVNFAGYIQNLVSYLFRSYGVSSNVIQLKIDADDVFLGIDTAVPCGLILNELISNSLKHAFPGGREGEIRIELCSDDDGRFTLMVSDNGVGLPEDCDFRDTESLGLQLVNTLVVGQLEGAIELDRSSGTAFEITFTELE